MSHFTTSYQLNTGQTGGPVGVDINVIPVWERGITGRGVVVSILDDGELVFDLALPYFPELYNLGCLFLFSC